MCTPCPFQLKKEKQGDGGDEEAELIPNQELS